MTALDFLGSFPYELCEATVYEIYDPGLARIVATFTDKAEAEAFIEARNQFLESGEKLMESFYNTTHEHGDTLTASRTQAARQDDQILGLFISNPQALFAPHEVQDELNVSWPLTSIRRSMTNLTERGYLEKTGQMRVGTFGKQVHTWRLSPQ